MGGNKEFPILALPLLLCWQADRHLHAPCIPLEWSLSSSAAVHIQGAGEKGRKDQDI